MVTSLVLEHTGIKFQHLNIKFEIFQSTCAFKNVFIFIWLIFDCLYLKFGLVNAKIWGYLVGSRTLKTQSNSDEDLLRMLDVAASMTWNVVKVLLSMQFKKISIIHFPNISEGVSTHKFWQRISKGSLTLNFSTFKCIAVIILTELPLPGRI